MSAAGVEAHPPLERGEPRGHCGWFAGTCHVLLRGDVPQGPTVPCAARCAAPERDTRPAGTARTCAEACGRGSPGSVSGTAVGGVRVPRCLTARAERHSSVVVGCRAVRCAARNCVVRNEHTDGVSHRIHLLDEWPPPCSALDILVFTPWAQLQGRCRPLVVLRGFRVPTTRGVLRTAVRRTSPHPCPTVSSHHGKAPAPGHFGLLREKPALTPSVPVRGRGSPGREREEPTPLAPRSPSRRGCPSRAMRTPAQLH